MNEISKEISFTGILRLKPNLLPFEFSIVLPGDKLETHFSLSFSGSFYDRFIEEVKGTQFLLESSCLIKMVSSDNNFNVKTNDKSKEIIIEQIEKINRIIDIVRYSHEMKYPIRKIHLRNVGLDDFIFYKLDIDGKNEIKMILDGFANNEDQVYKVDMLFLDGSYEWFTFTKAIDLLDLGYYNESLIIGFNLLDFCTQKAIKFLMGNLSEEEKDSLLRKIEKQRLTTYLGPLLKLLKGDTIYNDDLTYKKVSDLNSFRNKIIHNGETSSYDQTTVSLKVIYQIIKVFKKFGVIFNVPDRIIFYN